MEMVSELGKRYVRVDFFREGETEGIVSEYEYVILETSKMPGLMEISKQISDGKIYLMFSVCGNISLEHKIRRDGLNLDIFCNFFSQLMKLYENMQTFLLNADAICLDTQFIFYDEKSGKFFFVPIMERERLMSEKLEKLFAFFAEMCPTEEKALLSFLFENFRALAEENFDPMSFMRCIVSYKYRNEYSSVEVKPVVYEEEDYGYDLEETKDAEEEFESTGFRKTFFCCAVLLVVAFLLAYFMDYDFKYSLVSMAAVVIAVLLMARKTIKLTGFSLKRKKP